MKGVLEVGVDGRSYGSTLVRGNQIPTIGRISLAFFPPFSKDNETRCQRIPEKAGESSPR